MIKLDDQVIVYGYALEKRKDPREDRWYAFFNGVKMQVIDMNTEANCTTLLCREFDLNEGTIRDFNVHIGQVRKAK